MGKVVLLSGDLIARGPLENAARRLGLGWACVATVEALLAELESGGGEVVVLDLATGGLDVGDLLAALLKRSVVPPVIAFGPHVHRARLETARAAGCRAVYSRGEMLTQSEELLRAFVTADGPIPPAP